MDCVAEEDAAGGLLPQTVAGLIEKLVARVSERGCVTYDQLSAALSLDQLSSEEIEDTMTLLSELGITVTESDESEEPMAPEGEPAKAGGNIIDLNATYGSFDRAVVGTPGEAIATPPAGGKPASTYERRRYRLGRERAWRGRGQGRREFDLARCEGGRADAGPRRHLRRDGSSPWEAARAPA